MSSFHSVFLSVLPVQMHYEHRMLQIFSSHGCFARTHHAEKQLGMEDLEPKELLIYFTSTCLCIPTLHTSIGIIHCTGIDLEKKLHISFWVYFCNIRDSGTSIKAPRYVSVRQLVRVLPDILLHQDSLPFRKCTLTVAGHRTAATSNIQIYNHTILECLSL